MFLPPCDDVACESFASPVSKHGSRQMQPLSEFVSVSRLNTRAFPCQVSMNCRRIDTRRDSAECKPWVSKEAGGKSPSFSRLLPTVGRAIGGTPRAVRLASCFIAVQLSY